MESLQAEYSVKRSEVETIARSVMLEACSESSPKQRCLYFGQLVSVLETLSQRTSLDSLNLAAGRITLENYGKTRSLAEYGRQPIHARYCSLLHIANCASIDEVVDFALEETDNMLIEETQEILCMYSESRTLSEVQQWARKHAVLALEDYAIEYVNSGALQTRQHVLNVLRSVHADSWKLPTSLSFILLILFISNQQQVLQRSFNDSPLDVFNTVVLLTVAVILSPRAPQLVPACGLLTTGSRCAGLYSG